MKKQFEASFRTIQLPPDQSRAQIYVTQNLACDAAEFIAQLSINNIVLSGGSTPRALFKHLAKHNLVPQNLHFFWGDERSVPPDAPESNYRMAHETLLGPLGVAEDRIHRILSELDPGEAAQQYENELKRFFRTEWPAFDLILLGLGDDGHTASLFPGTSALTVEDRLVVANPVPKLNTTRITMTVPLVNRALRILFLISGNSKAQVLQEILQGSYRPAELPAQLIRPISGELYFFVDEAAGKFL